MKNFQIGRSMVEMLGVLAIIGVLSVGGLMGYSMGMQRYKVNKALNEVEMISSSFRTVMENQANYHALMGGVGEVSSDQLKAFGILENGHDTKNAFGGEIKLAVNTNGNFFHFAFYGIPKRACISIVSANYADKDLVSIGVNSEASVPGDNGENGGYLGGVFPVSIEKATETCNLDDNSVSWVYKHF